MKQIEEAVKIADFKFPEEAGWKLVWIFDHFARRCLGRVEDECKSRK